MILTQYDRKTGRILGQCVGVDPSHLPAGVGLINGVYDGQEYQIKGRKPVPLVDMPITVDGCTVSGIPKGAVVRHAGGTDRVSGTWVGSGYVQIECRGYRAVTLKLMTYAEKRAAEFPPIGDQLDAIWKALSSGDLTDEARDMIARIKAVKAAHPKG